MGTKVHVACFYHLILALALLAGCAPAYQSPASQPAKPAFETQDCWFEVPLGAQVTCGYVSVREDRRQAMTPQNTLRLAVAKFHSTASHPAPDPVVYQVGGPGGHMLVIAPFLYDRVIAPFLASRDLILFDPRGTGYSQPALECWPGEDPEPCLRRLAAEGRNLYAYNSVSLAADLQDIRAALGYDRWNLMAESYGTHVAQISMRLAPQGLRSVILDSVVPIVNPWLPGGQSTHGVALQRLFQHCQQDPACRAAYPDLPQALKDAIGRLDQNPVSLRAQCQGRERGDALTGNRLGAMISEALYEITLIPQIPRALNAAARGSQDSLWNQVLCWENVIDILVSEGAHWATWCSDGHLGEACENWPVAVEPVPTASELPVLVLSGEFDPVTPLEYGRAVAETLPHSARVEFPGMGHWLNGSGHACPAAIIQAFLADPAHRPDTACLQAMEEFSFLLPEVAETGAPAR